MWTCRALLAALPRATLPNRVPVLARAATSKAVDAASAADSASNSPLSAFFEPVEPVKKGEQPKFVVTGRSWRAAELRTHTFDDLHKLWYVLLRERNLLLTEKLESRRQQRPFDHKRLYKVKKSMARVKFVVHERVRLFKAARSAVEPSVLTAPTPASAAPKVA